MTCLLVTNTRNPHDNGQWIAAAFRRAGVDVRSVHPMTINTPQFRVGTVDFVLCLGAVLRAKWKCLPRLRKLTKVPIALWYFDAVATSDQSTVRRRDLVMEASAFVDHVFITDGGQQFGGALGNRLHWLMQGVPAELYAEDLRVAIEHPLAFFGALVKGTERTDFIEQLAGRLPVALWGRCLAGHVTVQEVRAEVFGKAMVQTASTCRALLAAEATYGFVSRYWSNRVYLMAGTGVPTLVKNIMGIKPEMGADGAYVRYYKTVDEACDIYRWIEQNPEQARAMGDRCRRFVLAHHTYDHRVARILETMELSECLTT